MSLPALTRLTIASALVGVLAVGCSAPQATGDGNRPNAAKVGDDDDDDGKPQGDDDTDADDDDDSDKDVTPPPKAGTTTGTTTQTQPPPSEPIETRAQCLTQCYEPVPEAVALYKCLKTCDANDKACSTSCYDTTACYENTFCGTALVQCGLKCPATMP
jgi:hypothetical protein